MTQELSIFVTIGAQILLSSLSRLMLIPVVDLVWFNLLICAKTSSIVSQIKSNTSLKFFCLITIMLGWNRKRVTIFSRGSFSSIITKTCALQSFFSATLRTKLIKCLFNTIPISFGTQTTLLEKNSSDKISIQKSSKNRTKLPKFGMVSKLLSDKVIHLMGEFFC